MLAKAITAFISLSFVPGHAECERLICNVQPANEKTNDENQLSLLLALLLPFVGLEFKYGKTATNKQICRNH